MEPSPTFRHNRIRHRIADQLRKFVSAHGLGEITEESDFRLGPETVRNPDVAFVTANHLKNIDIDRSPVGGAPALAVEVISPGDLVSELNQKLEEYLRAGVKIVWVIDPQQRIVWVHHPDGMSWRLHETDEISGEEVIPGFRCSVGAFFPLMPASESEPAPQSPVNPSA